MKQQKPIITMFEGRKLVVATKHKKEKVIAPLMEKTLGVMCFVNEGFDTDLLGTFTGEVPRELDPIATARKKCLMAMELSSCDLGVASEGSFGPHPTLLFVNSDDEILLFMDRKNNLEIIANELSTDTNFNCRQIQNEQELLDFAKSVNFPSHGLILRKSSKENSDLVKGITDWQKLKEAFGELHNKHNVVYAETDMRAMYNPTRMTVIKKAAKKLTARLSTCCPKCHTPGYGITDILEGMPCSLCGKATRSVKSYMYSCTKCAYSEEKSNTKKRYENPLFCDYCNP